MVDESRLPGDPVVELEVRPDGTVRVHVSGVPGPDCERWEAALQVVLRGEVVEREHTPEYLQAPRALAARLLARLRRT